MDSWIKFSHPVKLHDMSSGLYLEYELSFIHHVQLNEGACCLYMNNPGPSIRPVYKDLTSKSWAVLINYKRGLKIHHDIYRNVTEKKKEVS